MRGRKASAGKGLAGGRAGRTDPRARWARRAEEELRLLFGLSVLHPAQREHAETANSH